MKELEKFYKKRKGGFLFKSRSAALLYCIHRLDVGKSINHTNVLQVIKLIKEGRDTHHTSYEAIMEWFNDPTED